LAFAETHAYVTLESDVVGTREFERVETGQQRLGIRVVVPLAEYCRVGRASILVGYYVLVLDIVFDGFGDTASGVPSVDAYNTKIGHYRLIVIGDGNDNVTRFRHKSSNINIRSLKYF